MNSIYRLDEAQRRSAVSKAAEMAEFLKNEIKRNTGVIKAARIKLE